MDAPLPLPVADPLLGAVAPAATLPVDPALSGDTATAEGFALLLEFARLTLDAPATEADAAQVTEEPRDDASAASAASSSPLESLLFLANVSVPAPVAERLTNAPLASATSRATSAAIAPAASEILNGAPLPIAPIEDVALGAQTPLNVIGAVASSTRGTPTEPSVPALDAPLKSAASATPPAAQALAGEATHSLKPPTANDASQLVPTAPDVNMSTPQGPSEPSPAIPVTHSAPSSPLAAAVAVTIDAPVEQPRFREEVAERIVSLVTRGTERAELKVSPPDLGPVEVRIDLRGGEATLTIVAVQPATRDALENALPLLRDLLAQQGLALGQATVRDGTTEGQADPRDARNAGPGTAAESGSDETPAARVARAYRLVDIFA